MTDIYPKGVISLQYANDTLLFLRDDPIATHHLKWLLIFFEKLSGMRINYHKSDLTPINLSEEEVQFYAKTFCCKIGSFPFTYLVVTLHHDKLRREDIQPIIDKIMKRISGWKGRLLSYEARLTLLKAYLSSIPIYLMSIIKFSKWAIKAINTQMANFFWDDQEDKHKYHLSNLQSLCQTKDEGGMGVPNLRNLNLCLLASWVHRYYADNGKIWKRVIDAKYQYRSPNLFCAGSREASPFWKGVLCATSAAKMSYRWHVGDDTKIRFCEDHWFGSCSLAI
jgi:hypothetical protein